MNGPPQTRTAPGRPSGGGAEIEKVLWTAPRDYLAEARGAIAELLTDPRVSTLARETEPIQGALSEEVAAIVDLLDHAEAVTVDEREGGVE